MNKILDKSGYVALVILTVFCSYWILHNANWIIGDNIMFITGTAVGKNNAMMYGFGRFFPLAFQDFNILNYIKGGTSPLAHYIISVISFYAVIVSLAVFYAKMIGCHLKRDYLKSWLVFIFVLLFFLNVSFLSIFMDIIYPERMVMLWFALFMLTYWQGMESGKISWFILSGLISIINMFYKEPIFGSYMIFVAVMVIFNYRRLSKGQKIFNWMIIAGSLGFLVSYYYLVYLNTSVFYNQGRYYGGFLPFLNTIFEWNRLFYIFISLGVYRIWRLVFAQDRTQLFSDALLFAGLGYLCAFILLNLNAAYYFLPVYILCMPSLLVLTVNLLNKKLWLGFLVILISLACFYTYFIHVRGAIYFYQYKRQTDMVFIANLAEKYRQGNELIWYQVENKLPQNQFANISASDRLNKLEKFLGFVLHEDQIRITRVNKLPEKLEPNQLLIYPPENETENIIDYSSLGEKLVCSKSNNYFYYCEYQK